MTARSLGLWPALVTAMAGCSRTPAPPKPEPDGRVLDCRADGGSEAMDGGWVPTCGARVQGASCAQGPLGPAATSAQSYWTWEGNAPYVTGGGMPIESSLVEPEEVAAGEIRHALKMTIYDTMPGPRCDGTQRDSGADLGVTCGDAVAPAGNFEKDGSAGTPDELLQGVPEGMRFALHVTDGEIEAWLDSRADLNCGASCAPPRDRPGPGGRPARLRLVHLHVVRVRGRLHRLRRGQPAEKTAWQSLGITGPDMDFLRGLITHDRLWVVGVPQARCVDGALTRDDHVVVRGRAREGDRRVVVHLLMGRHQGLQCLAAAAPFVDGRCGRPETPPA